MSTKMGGEDQREEEKKGGESVGRRGVRERE